MATRSSTLAWMATGLLLLTAPFVARAQVEDASSPFGDPGDAGTSAPGEPPPVDGGAGAPSIDGGSAFEDAGRVDGAAAPGPQLPDGGPYRQPGAGDAGGWSCAIATGASTRSSDGVAGGLSVAFVACAAIASRRLRMRRSRRP